MRLPVCESPMSLKFVRQFALHPNSVGAVAPSSRALAVRMVSWMDWDAIANVVEYGPGTGPFTAQILDRLQPGGTFFTVEQNADFARQMQEHFPEVTTFCDSVENVRSLCRQVGIDEVDAVVCGLPWAAFSEDLQDRLLDAMLEVLSENGSFATFAYLQGLLLPAGQRFRRKLDERFSSVRKSPVVWRNLPPAFVYQCRK